MTTEETKTAEQVVTEATETKDVKEAKTAKPSTEEVKPKKVKAVKVKALQPMAGLGYSYFEGDEFEVSSELAEVWLEIKAVEILK